MMPEPGDHDHARFVIENTAIASPPLLPELRLHLASAVTPLWSLTARDLNEHDVPPPFWAFAWPGGQAVARLVLDRPELVRGLRVLDLGAGCGVAAIAASLVGAIQVTAADIDPLAVAALRLNAKLNRVMIEATDSDLTQAADRSFDVILAGDLCYEPDMAQRIVTWLTAQATRGVTVLLGDPGRAYLPAGLRELARYAVPTTTEIEDATVKTAVVYALS